MVNVAGPRRSVAKLMVDTCKITRLQEQYSRGAMDSNTGKVTPATPEQIYSDLCFVAPYGLQQARRDDVGGNEASQKTYLNSIPWDAPEIRPGDEVTMLTSKTDPLLAGKTFKVEEISYSSVLVWRQFKMVGLETSRG